MKIKDRIFSAIKFKGVDRIPILFRGLPPLSKKLMKYFKIGDFKDSNILLKYYRTLLKELGADIWAAGGSAAFSNFSPKYIGPELKLIDRDYFSVLGVEIKEITIKKYNYSYTVCLRGPLADYDSPKNIEGFLTNKLDYFDYKNSVNNLLNYGKNSEYYNNPVAEKILNYDNFKNSDEDIVTMGNIMTNPFMLCCYLRGMDNFLFDLIGNKKMAEALINEVELFVIEFNRRSINKTQIKPMIFATWDDVATQNGLMFSPDIFKKYFLPIWKKLISIIKSKKIFFTWHCCGNVNEVLPMMIDAGIDVFDVVQTSAKDMEIEKIYKRYGKSICVHGGVDVQQLLVMKGPKEIKEEVKKIRELWGKRGGAIIGPSHDILPETPIKNILAIYEGFEE